MLKITYAISINNKRFTFIHIWHMLCIAHFIIPVLIFRNDFYILN